jgi:DNA-binding NtrC family response regulator
MDKFECTAAPTLRLDGDTDVMSVPRRPILVVDDEENFLTLLQWFLKQRGYEVVTASSAEDALGLLNGQVFSVALLDVKLGASNGVNLLGHLVQRMPDLKVIMMTAYPTVSSIKQAFQEGAARYLTKPIDLTELAETIRVLI